MKRYRLRKKYSVSAIAILIVVIAILIFMNTGYSLWSSKLDIYGKVTLDFDPPLLEVSLVPESKERIVTNTNLSSDTFSYFSFVSNDYANNSLVNTIQVEKNFGVAWTSKEISSKFTIKNSSKEGNMYTNGKVQLIEFYDPGRAVSNINTTLLPTTISSGNVADFNFSATINRGALTNNTFYKYAITYDVNGITRYFFYTMKILPAQ